MRETAVRGESEQLPLADLPIPNAVTGTRIDLDGFYLGFEAGRKVLLEGEPVDLPGTRVLEVLTLEQVTIEGGYTVLTLRAAAAAFVRAHERDDQRERRRRHARRVEVRRCSAAATRRRRSSASRSASRRSPTSARRRPAAPSRRSRLRRRRALARGAVALRPRPQRARVRHAARRRGRHDRRVRRRRDGRAPADRAARTSRPRYRKGIGLVGDVQAGQLSAAAHPAARREDRVEPAARRGRGGRRARGRRARRTRR